MKKKTKQTLLAIVAIAILVALDQWTKALAVSSLKGKASFPIIKDVFELTYVENIGAAFSSMEGKTIWLIGSTSVLMVFVSWLYTRIPDTRKWMIIRFTLVAVVAGGIGNFIDRVRFKYVVDFLYFKLINFPVFNVADCYVTIAAFTIIIMSLFVLKEEDWKEVTEHFPKWLQSKKKNKEENNKEE